MSHNLPDLPYDFGALEPHIDAKTMEIHHDKHHAAYVAKLNAALEQAGPEWQDKPIEQLMREIDQVPEAVRGAIRNNGGGHANHSLFWQTMSPDGGGTPDGKLGEAINTTFGSFNEFQTKFANAGATQFGSGWAWLCFDGDKLCACSTPNQDNPWMKGRTALLGCDVWEHAYYLKYQNKRPDYIAAWWNTVNWSKVGELYASACK